MAWPRGSARREHDLRRAGARERLVFGDGARAAPRHVASPTRSRPPALQAASASVNRGWPLALAYAAIAISALRRAAVANAGAALARLRGVLVGRIGVERAGRSVLRKRSGRPSGPFPALKRDTTNSCRSSIRRRHSCSGASSRDCRTAAAAAALADSSLGALLALIATVLRASGAPRAALLFFSALALAMRIGTDTRAILALDSSRCPRSRATLLVGVTRRSFHAAGRPPQRRWHLPAPNAALGLASQFDRSARGFRSRSQPPSRTPWASQRPAGGGPPPTPPTRPLTLRPSDS